MTDNIKPIREGITPVARHVVPCHRQPAQCRTFVCFEDAEHIARCIQAIRKRQLREGLAVIVETVTE